MAIEDHMNEALVPCWGEFDSHSTHVHDWRSYVPDEVRARWDEIPLLGRCAVIACCQEAADREDWD